MVVPEVRQGRPGPLPDQRRRPRGLKVEDERRRIPTRIQAAPPGSARVPCEKVKYRSHPPARLTPGSGDHEFWPTSPTREPSNALGWVGLGEIASDAQFDADLLCGETEHADDPTTCSCRIGRPCSARSRATRSFPSAVGTVGISRGVRSASDIRSRGNQCAALSTPIPSTVSTADAERTSAAVPSARPMAATAGTMPRAPPRP